MNQPINGEKKQYHHPWNCFHGEVEYQTYTNGKRRKRYVCDKRWALYEPKDGDKIYRADFLDDFDCDGGLNYEVCKICEQFDPRHIPELCKFSSTETYENTCSECGKVDKVRKIFCRMVIPNPEISENGEQCFDCDRFQWR